MQQKYFIDPFAIAGDITPDIPDTADPLNFVSYNQGFTFDYQRDLVSDPLAKSILRININAVLNDITTNVQDYQRNGTPEFITAAQNGGTAFSYRINAMVRYSASGTAPFDIYINRTDNNTKLPTATNSGWQRLPSGFPLAPTNVAVSTAWTIAADGFFVYVSVPGTTQTLPSPATVTGMKLGFITNIAGGFTLATAAGIIFGDILNTVSVNVPSGGYVCLQSDGINWRVFSASPGFLGYATVAALNAETARAIGVEATKIPFSAFTFTNPSNNNSWSIRSDGLIEQAFQAGVATTNGFLTTTFPIPIAFPNALIDCSISFFGGLPPLQGNVGVQPFDRANVSITTNNNASGTFGCEVRCRGY